MQKVSVIALAFCAALAAESASAQAPRVWVSGVGDDASDCSRTKPCRTFAGASQKLAPGGEISVLDPGGYGVVTITKSLSINGQYAGEAGIVASQTSGIFINGPGIVVNLRGLVIDGLGNGTNGIHFINGAALRIQDLVIRNFKAGGPNRQNGIYFAPTGPAVLEVSDTLIDDNGVSGIGAGIQIRPTAGGSVKATLTDVQLLGNQKGLLIDGDVSTGTIDVTVRNSDVSGNLVEGIRVFSPNGSDALVRVTVTGSALSNNGAQGIQSVGQRATVRVGSSTVTGNGAAGLQANNSGTLASYGNNFTDGNALANVGVTSATPN